MNNAIKLNKILIICIVLLFGLIIGKLIYVSASTNIDGINIKEFAASRTTEKRTLYASRGSIYDSSGEVLSENVNSYTVIAYLSESRTQDKNDPQHVVDVENTVKKLSPVLGMDEKRLRELLSREAYQVELGPEGRGISELEKEKIEKLNLPGIDFIKDSKRYYPYGSFASYIVGYAKKNENGNIVGEMGIESYYDKELSGKDGYIEYQKDAYGYQISGTDIRETKAVSGHNIYLTIDSNIQMYLENAVNELVSNNKTEWVTVTIADANTGAIVGAASSPTFDPNKLDIKNYNNPLVSYVYEPGSTMKIFSFMSSIEEGKYNGDETYASGNIKVDDYYIYDWNKGGWGLIPFDIGFGRSSNVAATILAQRVGKEKLKEYYNKLGFGKNTGIELYGELPGKVSFFYETELASVSYGQGMTVTPIQMVQALTSITNKGTVLKPYIVDKITDENGEVVYEGKRTELNKVFKESTTEKIKELMDNTVNGEDLSATGKIYATNLVRLIGKTGTAQYIENGKYVEGGNRNIRSFAGIFPRDNPEYIIYIAVKDLDAGSTEIAKLVKSVVESISKYKNLNERESNLDKTKYVTLDSYLNKDVKEISKKISKLGLTPVVIGSGEKVVEQYPKKENTIIIGSKVFLKTNKNDKIMLDITGWNQDEVMTLFNMMDVDYSIKGTGKVKSFNIKVGKKINKQLIINLES